MYGYSDIWIVTIQILTKTFKSSHIEKLLYVPKKGLFSEILIVKNWKETFIYKENSSLQKTAML